MRFGFVMPFSDARDIVDAAVVAESTGWDAIFVWERVWGDVNHPGPVDNSRVGDDGPARQAPNPLGRARSREEDA